VNIAPERGSAPTRRSGRAGVGPALPRPVATGCGRCEDVDGGDVTGMVPGADGHAARQPGVDGHERRPAVELG
jgi:hypothetical protein